jgi:hypothetical protein
MRKGINISLILSESDYAFLDRFSSDLGLKKSEFLRLFIQGLKVGEAMNNAKTTNKGLNVEVGGYGFEFSQSAMNSFVKQLEPLLEGFSDNVKVNPIKTPIRARNRKIKGFKKVA